MAIARTGVYVDDYLDTLAGDLQRILSTMRELDDRAHGIMGQTKEQIKYILGVSSHGYDRSNMDDDESERMKKDIEASQDNALSLCTEKKGRYLQMNLQFFLQFRWLAGMRKGGLALVHLKHQRNLERGNGTGKGAWTLI
nr:unnamed protein product [Digitaria exilis]